MGLRSMAFSFEVEEENKTSLIEKSISKESFKVKVNESIFSLRITKITNETKDEVFFDATLALSNESKQPSFKLSGILGNDDSGWLKICG